MNTKLKSGIDQIAEERAAHFTRGYLPEHDDEHVNGELAYNAAALAVEYLHKVELLDDKEYPHQLWDLAAGRDRTRCLVIAGALIAAEIDRLQRAGR